MTGLNHQFMEDFVLFTVLRGSFIEKPPKVLPKGHCYYTMVILMLIRYGNIPSMVEYGTLIGR